MLPAAFLGGTFLRKQQLPFSPASPHVQNGASAPQGPQDDKKHGPWGLLGLPAGRCPGKPCPWSRSTSEGCYFNSSYLQYFISMVTECFYLNRREKWPECFRSTKELLLALNTWLWKAGLATSTIGTVQNICMPGRQHLLQDCWSTSCQWKFWFPEW